MWKKKYIQALPLASLDRVNGGNYVIQSSGFPETDRHVIALMDGGNRLGLEMWHNDFVNEKMFKLEPCTDHPGDWIITSYGSKEKQWIVENNEPDKPATLETKAYPNGSDERLRPPLRQWRFTFEDANPLGSKKYRIVSKDEDLEDAGMNYLQVGAPNEKYVSEF